ncbi:MAG: AAA family ATPase [Aestuariivirga sp.]|uniref:bifunctional aminoglycoside phosphotransferase/ATP-binding protein n=1 Tax=Aestuariivirga sp. TaxID=2650926 RepID=UPI0025BFCEDC|nr:bifunctional aminoglycoside phosphotransferase/ATP-binding protein [Aestuariivirga sp.]MCA3559756.1 AAA family ATPase [Aestuariivirga sp.]
MFTPAFLKGETWGLPGQPVEHVETHAAHVFLVGELAFKIKKDVRLPYLDFSTPEKRRAALMAELAINRLFTPELYLRLEEVLGEPVLVMHRFPAHELLAWRMGHGGIDGTLAVKLASMVAVSHDRAPRRDIKGSDIMTGLGAQLSKAFIDSPDIFAPADTLEFHALYEAALRFDRQLLSDRGERGLVRRCHGDVHCGNIFLESGEPRLFDAIEFSEKIATIDVLYDLAFLLMDLWSSGVKVAANVVLNRYLHLRRRQEDLSGLSLLPLFLSTRAGVRALVTADLAHELAFKNSMMERSQALDWFRSSVAYLKVSPPMLLCIGGLSGSGKSTVAAALAPFLGAAPGAIHVRSDVERKVLAGVPETERLPAESYSLQASFEVYAACLARAEKALAARHSVVLDAVFARPDERAAAAELARRTRAHFAGVWLDAPRETLAARVAARSGDASDATAEVVDAQLRYDLGPMDWPRVDAGGTAAQTLLRLRGTVPFRFFAPS